jgi:hypothetical protein
VVDGRGGQGSEGTGGGGLVHRHNRRGDQDE